MLTPPSAASRKGRPAFARRGLPVRFVGVGEGMDDLMPFDAGAFVDALFLRET